ncbi:flavodoxin domain-containing protein [Gilvimarinus agarilyticus]|uniref:flavodoxin domain-containing protein n=1 Tax=Gilvimarinus agarilyticus TaxID=679259 RepID=UPI000697F125|nr:sulfite reductase flavoprotein subunit alpha [Gilvimarinus agarilyticus]
MSEFERIALALLLALFYGAFCWYCFSRRRITARVTLSQADVVVAYASQSGRAHALAEKACEAFAGRASLCALNQLTPSALQQSKTLLIVASTYGEGEAPDNGALFEKRLIRQTPDLSLNDSQFAVVALGDSYYSGFCAFGRRVYSALQQSEARALADCIELDASKPEQELEALTQLKALIKTLGGRFDIDTAEASVVPDRYWATLQRRQKLNDGSPGAPLYSLTINTSDTVNYSAGDIAEVYPLHDTALCKQQLVALGLTEDATLELDGQAVSAWRWLASRQWPLPEKPASLSAEQWLKHLPEEAPRQYTIANAYTPNRLQLVVRQLRNTNGELGVASGWLTERADVGDKLELAIRDNQEFHTPPAEQPLVLIGNGSGIAGLRAHWQQRDNTGGEACWVLYGERDADTDRPFADELAQLQTKGVIQELDCVYSRSGEYSEYVQQRLLRRGDLLKSWLERNACIYVCGSRVGMGQGVHEALLELLGEPALDELQAAGRYRRDVY